MKTTSKFIATALAVASLAAVSVVSAHPDGSYGRGCGAGMGPNAGLMGQGMGPGAGMGRMGGMRGFDSPAVTTARLGDLKTELQITPAQEAAWATYAGQVQQQMQQRQALHTAMQAQMQDPKASIDRNAHHQAMSQLWAAQTEARNALLAVLTPEQKARFEAPQGRGYGPGHGPGYGPGYGHGRHMGWSSPAPAAK